MDNQSVLKTNTPVSPPANQENTPTPPALSGSEPIPPKVQQHLDNVPPANDSLKPHHTKKFWSAIIGILLLLILVITSVVWFFLSGSESKSAIEKTRVVQPLVTPSITPTPDPTSGWVELTDTDYNFSFKHPKDWEVVSNIKKTETILLTLKGPTGLELKVLLGPSGVGGKCDETPVVQQEPVNVFGKSLTLFYNGDKTKQIVTYAYIIRGDIPCPNIAFIDISDLTEVKPGESGISLANIILSYGIGQEKVLDEFKTQDVETAKQILTTFSISKASIVESDVTKVPN